MRLQERRKPMSDCLFCKIVRGDIPADKVYESDGVIVFRDIDPKAPVHLLAIPHEHYSGIHEIPDTDMDIMKRVNSAVSATVKQENLDKEGYRLVVNYGTISGQAVPHIHVHILSGRPMDWPPG